MRVKDCRVSSFLTCSRPNREGCASVAQDRGPGELRRVVQPVVQGDGATDTYSKQSEVKDMH